MAEACEKCLRWPECNGVDESCPLRKGQPANDRQITDKGKGG